MRISRKWRMGWDSNPRDAFTSAGFQDRCLQPLGHPSSLYSNYRNVNLASSFLSCEFAQESVGSVLNGVK